MSDKEIALPLSSSFLLKNIKNGQRNEKKLELTITIVINLAQIGL
jgi:hypothetical protein